MQVDWGAAGIGSVVLLLGIGMLFLEQTKGVAPFLIGFGIAKLANSSTS